MPAWAGDRREIPALANFEAAKPPVGSFLRSNRPADPLEPSRPDQSARTAFDCVQLEMPDAQDIPTPLGAARADALADQAPLAEQRASQPAPPSQPDVEQQQAAAAQSEAQRETQPGARPAAATKPAPKPWHWHVVLLNDDHHTYDYVVRMVQELFGRTREDAYAMALKVDGDGRVVLLKTHREHAELKREQIIAFGRDPLMASSKGPMSAVLEPAE